MVFQQLLLIMVLEQAQLKQVAQIEKEIIVKHLMLLLMVVMEDYHLVIFHRAEIMYMTQTMGLVLVVVVQAVQVIIILEED